MSFREKFANISLKVGFEDGFHPRCVRASVYCSLPLWSTGTPGCWCRSDWSASIERRYMSQGKNWISPSIESTKDLIASGSEFTPAPSGILVPSNMLILSSLPQAIIV